MLENMKGINGEYDFVHQEHYCSDGAIGETRGKHDDEHEIPLKERICSHEY